MHVTYIIVNLSEYVLGGTWKVAVLPSYPQISLYSVSLTGRLYERYQFDAILVALLSSLC